MDVLSVMWTTKEATSPTVMWGTESKSYQATSSVSTHVLQGSASYIIYNHYKAETTTYSASNMCGTPATGYGYRDPGLFHRATMTE